MFTIELIWNTLCHSCDVTGTQSESSKGKMSIGECKKLCEQEMDCMGIDYGKGSRLQECYLNLGVYDKHIKHNDFDAYILSRQDVKRKNPLISRFYKWFLLKKLKIVFLTIRLICRNY